MAVGCAAKVSLHWPLGGPLQTKALRAPNCATRFAVGCVPARGVAKFSSLRILGVLVRQSFLSQVKQR